MFFIFFSVFACPTHHVHKLLNEIKVDPQKQKKIMFYASLSHLRLRSFFVKISNFLLWNSYFLGMAIWALGFCPVPNFQARLWNRNSAPQSMWIESNLPVVVKWHSNSTHFRALNSMNNTLFILRFMVCSHFWFGCNNLVFHSVSFQLKNKNRAKKEKHVREPLPSKLGTDF